MNFLSFLIVFLAPKKYYKTRKYEYPLICAEMLGEQANRDGECKNPVGDLKAILC